MSRSNREIAQLYALATARYRNTPAVLAIAYFESDRRAAGMGALKSGYDYNRQYRNVSNTKTHDRMSDKVQYDRHISVPAFDRFPELEMPVGSIDDFDPNACITLVRVPARNMSMACRVDREDFQTQAGRNKIASLLRRLRAETREA
jgi:hypothetical protein